MSVHPRTVYNFVAYQVAWFACVLGAANGHTTIGPLTVMVVVLLHLFLSPQPRADFKLMGCALAIGLVHDTALLQLGILDFSVAAWSGEWPPPWMFALWIAFATTLNESLNWLMQRRSLAMLGGAIGGPLAYLAGERLGALTLHSTWALPAVGLGWALAMLALSTLCRQLRAGLDSPAYSTPAKGGA